MRSIVGASMLVLFGTLALACGGEDDIEETESTATDSAAMKCTAMYQCTHNGQALQGGYCGDGTGTTCASALKSCQVQEGTFTLVNCNGAF